MRLYDQTSRTPVASIGLDAKKLRPVGFLSNGYGKVAADSDIEDRSPKQGSKVLDVASLHSDTTASSNVEPCIVIRRTVSHDEFLFDISETDVWSADSSSTLSTHASFRHNPKPTSRTFGRLEAAEKPSIDCEKASTAVKNAPKSSPKTSVSIGKDRRYEELVPIPELSFTESSSEDTESDWFEFTDKPSSANPFHGGNKTEDTKPETSIGLLLYPVQERSASKMISGLYSTYTRMLKQGNSVGFVTYAMKSDGVDPTIIELMLAASESNGKQSD